MKRKPAAPRNPYVAVARFMKAGKHAKSAKALRRAAKMELSGCSSDGSSNRLLTGRSRVRCSPPGPVQNIYKSDSVFAVVLKVNSSLAQPVERVTVNHDVGGSSPPRGAIFIGV